MHNPDYVPATPISSAIHISSIPPPPPAIGTSISLQFAPNQSAPEQRKLIDIIGERTQRKEFFYGIEVIARSFRPTTLDYNGFGAMLPLFTSLVWLSQDYWNVTPVAEVESIRMMKQLQPYTIVMPHLTCYRLTRTRLAELMAMNISNVLVLRADVVDPEQDFQHASDLVAEIRKLRGDTITIGVGGYPDGHPDSSSFDDDIEFLANKINVGADFIITQICYSSKSLIKFITACRAKGITVPIILGVFIPHNLQILCRINEVARVGMHPNAMKEYVAHSSDVESFREYAQQQAVKMIKEVFESGLDIYGVQFFTMSNFKNVQQTLQKLLPEIKVQNVSENIA